MDRVNNYEVGKSTSAGVQKLHTCLSLNGLPCSKLTCFQVPRLCVNGPGTFLGFWWTLFSMWDTEFNALDPRTAACMEFLAQCNARKAKESNPACQLMVKRRTDDHPPQITVTFVNGVEEAFDATTTPPAQTIRTMILDKGQLLETEQMFRDAGEQWPVIIPEEEIRQAAPGTKYGQGKQKRRSSNCI
ncbi:unnamed protein product [Camellia sinensis]